MASEPLTGSISENLADDVPGDVDFNAVMARSQAQILASAARSMQANEDLKQKLIMAGKLVPSDPVA